jgi:hypothetical protein
MSQFLTASAAAQLNTMLRLFVKGSPARKGDIRSLHTLLAGASPTTYMPSYGVFANYRSAKTAPSYQVMGDLLLRWRLVGGPPLQGGNAVDLTARVIRELTRASPAQTPSLRQIQWGVERLVEELADCGRAFDPSLCAAPDSLAADAALPLVRKHVLESK